MLSIGGIAALIAGGAAAGGTLVATKTLGGDGGTV
jgi:hypothetical protein